MVVGNLLYLAAEKLKGKMVDDLEHEIEEHYKHPDYVKWDQEKLFGNAYPSYSWSGNIAEVEIDPITYEVKVTNIYGVYDFGRVIDETMAIGQVHGGAIQGMGYALMEDMFSENGKIVQNNMEAYSVPTAKDIPEIHCAFVNNEYVDGPFGAKGIGEITLVGLAPAIASAIENAIDRDITKIPVTPEYIMEVYENDSEA